MFHNLYHLYSLVKYSNKFPVIFWHYFKIEFEDYIRECFIILGKAQGYNKDLLFLLSTRPRGLKRAESGHFALLYGSRN